MRIDFPTPLTGVDKWKFPIPRNHRIWTPGFRSVALSAKVIWPADSTSPAGKADGVPGGAKGSCEDVPPGMGPRAGCAGILL